MLVTDLTALSAGLDEAELEPAAALTETNEHVVARFIRHIEVRRNIRHYSITPEPPRHHGRAR